MFEQTHLYRVHLRQRRSAGGTGVRDGLCRPVARQGAERKGCANLRRYGGGKVAIAYSHPSIMVCCGNRWAVNYPKHHERKEWYPSCIKTHQHPSLQIREADQIMHHQAQGHGRASKETKKERERGGG